jgi:hypothetical protein
VAIYVTKISRGINDISYSAFEFFGLYLGKKIVGWILKFGGEAGRRRGMFLGS